MKNNNLLSQFLTPIKTTWKVEHTGKKIYILMELLEATMLFFLTFFSKALGENLVFWTTLNILNITALMKIDF